MSIVITRARWKLDHDLDVYTQQRGSLYLTKSGDSGHAYNSFPSSLTISGYPRGVSLSCLTQGDTAVLPLTGIQSGVVH